MSTIIVATLLGSLVIAICLLLLLLDKKQQRQKMTRLLGEFSKWGAANSLSFSSQLLINNSVIGLDGIHRKLLVVTTDDWILFNHFLIDLKEVKACTVKKVYGIINNNRVKRKALDEHLERVGLCCDFFANKPPAEIVFFNRLYDPYYEIPALKQKANDWKIIISQVLDRPLKERA